MDFIRNFPFISILLSLFSGPLSTIVSKKAARVINLIVMITILALSSCVFLYTFITDTSYIYMMGHFPAPWGNEIRFGPLEGFMATFFSLIMLLSVIGGSRERTRDIDSSKENLYYVMTNLLLTSLIALVYTNDMFTAYVFVEINTIAACGLIMIRENGKTFVAATRYLVMSLVGSGMLLLGICFLYSVTGQLLMSSMNESVRLLMISGQYKIPLLIALGFMSIGLAVKSALFPFHTWLPDAYGYSTVSSQAMLSSLVSKGYIFLLIKIYYRVMGIDAVNASNIANVLFVFGVCGMIIGSVDAIGEHDIMRMVAYSSVAQIGYIFMGLGLGTDAGTVASIYHILSHAATKALLFISASALINASEGKRDFKSLTGAAYRNRLAGAAFAIGSVSMVGVPMFSGFISKYLFATAAIGHRGKTVVTFVALAISTILNAIYFMKTVIRIYMPSSDGEAVYTKESGDKMWPGKIISLVSLCVLNLVLGMVSDPIIGVIEKGLMMFS